MSDDIEKLNKRVASFMLVSLALSASVLAGNLSNNNITNGINKDFNINSEGYTAPLLLYGIPKDPVKPEVMPPVIRALYAVPEPPVKDIVPIQSDFNIALYAVPNAPIKDITKPTQPTNNIALYAVPSAPIGDIKDSAIVAPLEREMTKSMPGADSVDKHLYKKNMSINVINTPDNAFYIQPQDFKQ